MFIEASSKCFINREEIIMASNTNRPRHSGFETPTYGTVHAKGTKVRKNKDGTVTIIEPKKKDDKKKKKSTK